MKQLEKLTRLIRVCRYILRVIGTYKNWIEICWAYLKKGWVEYVKLRNGFVFQIDARYDVRNPWANTELAVINEVFIVNVYPEAPSSGIIVDIGANIGAFTIFCLKSPDIFVYSYEPASDAFFKLQGHVQSFLEKTKSKGQVRLFQMAVTNNSGKIELFGLTNSSPTRSTVLKKHSSCKVPSCTLKDIFITNSIQYIDYLKMDSEGSEYEIFYNLEERFLRAIRVICGEFHDIGDQVSNSSYNSPNLIQYLERHNFILKSRLGNIFLLENKKYQSLPPKI